jgi:hypothetical protein
VYSFIPVVLATVLIGSADIVTEMNDWLDNI